MKKGINLILQFIALSIISFCSTLPENQCIQENNCFVKADKKALKQLNQSFYYTVIVRSAKIEATSTRFSESDIELDVQLEEPIEAKVESGIQKALAESGINAKLIPIHDLNFELTNKQEGSALSSKEIAILNKLRIDTVIYADLKISLDYSTRLTNWNSGNFLFSLGYLDILFFDAIGYWFGDAEIDVEIQGTDEPNKKYLISAGNRFETDNLFLSFIRVDLQEVTKSTFRNIITQ